MSQSIQHRFQLWGWILFVFSALCFVASSIRAGDPLSLAGGLLFLVACFVFLVPLGVEAGWLGADWLNSLSRRNRYSLYRRGWSRAARCLWRAPAAPSIWPAQEHLRDQIRRQQVRSELRFFASTR